MHSHTERRGEKLKLKYRSLHANIDPIPITNVGIDVWIGPPTPTSQSHCTPMTTFPQRDLYCEVCGDTEPLTAPDAVSSVCVYEQLNETYIVTRHINAVHRPIHPQLFPCLHQTTPSPIISSLLCLFPPSLPATLFLYLFLPPLSFPPHSSPRALYLYKWALKS